jgi:DNA invertase Pin-like site-specific DNA recombinase
MRKAFSYLRVSGLGQVEGDGFTRQAATISAYADQFDIQLVQQYREEGVCGATELENRPALTRMVTALLSDGVKLVLIEKLDRLARDLMVQETIIADFRKNGIELVSCMEPDLCMDDPSRKLVRQIMGAIAEYDRVMIVARTKAARQRIRVRDGRCEGRKPFGDKLGEREILEEIVKLSKIGRNSSQIADWLNQNGQPTRYGGQWFPAQVQRIIRRSA